MQMGKRDDEEKEFQREGPETQEKPLQHLHQRMEQRKNGKKH